MRIDVVTLFPEMIQDAARYGVMGRAIKNDIVKLGVWNPRRYTSDKRETVDNRPYGGGSGMIMMVQPLRDAIQSARADDGDLATVIYLSPQGKRIGQQDLVRFSRLKRLILVAGRYEGIDERIIESEIDEEWSLGDYVLSGGELAALVLIDGVTRLIPGVLGDSKSSIQESHMLGLLDYPQYTRPEIIDGKEVPKVLQSGNHCEIERWRKKQSLGRTWQRRPDMMQRYRLSFDEERLLNEFINEESLKEE